MNLTKKQYAILLNSLAILVDLTHAQNEGRTPKAVDLSVMKEVQEFFSQALGDQTEILFNEVDDLFTTLFKAATIQDLDEQQKNLAELEPSSPYLH